MAAGIPPPPLNSPQGSYYWLEWYSTLTNFLDGTNIPWGNLNFTGSDLKNIFTRLHNDLQAIQGGNTNNAWHMVGPSYIGMVSGPGVAVQLPTGWTVSSSGAVYTVTHGLNLTPTSYVVNPVATGSPATVNQVVHNANSFVVTLSGATAWSFSLHQGS